MRAESIKIETDEDGFWLRIETDELAPFDRLEVKITDPEALYNHVKAVIGPWLYEREKAFAEFRQAVKSGSGPAAAFLCAVEDIDESGGYDVSDPKHPQWHSTHADVWDAREGK